MLENSDEAAPFAFLSGTLCIGSERVKAALSSALVPALTRFGQCGIGTIGEGEGSFPLSETSDLSRVSVRSSTESYI
jgi:hypothetical protein